MPATTSEAYRHKLHEVMALKKTNNQDLANILGCSITLVKKIIKGHQPGLKIIHDKMREFMEVGEDDYKMMLEEPRRVRAKPRPRIRATHLQEKLRSGGFITDEEPLQDPTV